MTEGQASAEDLQAGPTASRPTYRLVQVLRALAALMVVVHHSTLTLNERVGITGLNWFNGASGVDIFFVISGFVMTISSAPLLRQLHPARTFLARRLERIVPMYWIVTTIKLVTLLVAPALAINAMGTWWHVIASYLFLPSWNPYAQHDPLLSIGWTLNFEMAFYALFAIALAMRVSIWKVTAPVLIFVALIHSLPQPWMPPAVLWYERPMVLEFLFGILLALGLHRVRKMPVWLSAGLMTCGLALLLRWYEPLLSEWRGIEWGIPALMVVGSAVALERRIGILAPRWILELGDASYSIYLTHELVLPAVTLLIVKAGIDVAGSIWSCVAVMTVAAVAAGEVIYRLVELPIMRFFKGRRRAAVPANA